MKLLGIWASVSGEDVIVRCFLSIALVGSLQRNKTIFSNLPENVCRFFFQK